MQINAHLLNRLKHRKPQWTFQKNEYYGDLEVFTEHFYIEFGTGRDQRRSWGTPFKVSQTDLMEMTHINQVLAFIETEIAIRNVQ